VCGEDLADVRLLTEMALFYLLTSGTQSVSQSVGRRDRPIDITDA